MRSRRKHENAQSSVPILFLDWKERRSPSYGTPAVIRLSKERGSIIHILKVLPQTNVMRRGRRISLSLYKTPRAVNYLMPSRLLLFALEAGFRHRPYEFQQQLSTGVSLSKAEQFGNQHAQSLKIVQSRTRRCPIRSKLSKWRQVSLWAGGFPLEKRPYTASVSR